MNVTEEEACIIGMWNCEGLRKGIEDLPPAKLNLYHVFVCTETWETQEVVVPSFHIAQYPARKPEGPGRPSGGVAVIYKDRLTNAVCELAEDDTVVVSTRNCVIIAMYVRPSEPLETLVDKLNHVADHGFERTCPLFSAETSTHHLTNQILREPKPSWK